MCDPMIHIDALTYTYPSREAVTLKDCRLQVGRGQFVLLAGPTGCGKSTLLKAVSGLIPHHSGGILEGRVRVAGLDTSRSPMAALSQKVGLVFQNPEDQLFATTVEDEAAFGPENLALPRDEIERRVRDSLDQVGLAGMDRCAPQNLSGGQKQRLAIAAVLAMQPEILLLDEPFAQLDPLGIREVLAVIRRLHRQGMTVVMAEHRLQRMAQVVDRLVVMGKSCIIADGPVREVFGRPQVFRDLGLRVPPSVTVSWAVGFEDVALNPAEIRKKLNGPPVRHRLARRQAAEPRPEESSSASVQPSVNAPPDPPPHREEALSGSPPRPEESSFGLSPEPQESPSGSSPPAAGAPPDSSDSPGSPAPSSSQGCHHPEDMESSPHPQDSVGPPHCLCPAARPCVLELEGVCFRYTPKGPDILSGIDLKVHAGEIVALMGSNGCGKSTLLWLCAGLLQPGAGRLMAVGSGPGRIKPWKMVGKTGIVFQNPTLMLFNETVEAELAFGPAALGLNSGDHAARLELVADRLGIADLMEDNPLALSMGQRLRVATGAVLTMAPCLILLDEPTSGQDQANAEGLLTHLLDRTQTGSAVLFSTHDVDMAMHYATRLLVMDAGHIQADGPPRAVVKRTALMRRAHLRPPEALRIGRVLNREAFTVEELVEGLACSA